MKKFSASLAIYMVFLIFCFSGAVGSDGAIDDSQAYCVFENVVAHNAGSHVISRIDWLRVARCGEAANLAPKWQRAPENQISSKMTYLEAAALMDAMRLSFGTPNANDRFHGKCDRQHYVWKEPGSNPLRMRYAHINTGAEDPGSSFVLDRSNLCCEDAAMIVTATPGEDCRTFNLVSVRRGRVARTPGGWVSLTGFTLTVRPPNKPPIIIPAAEESAQDIAGKYILRHKAVGAQCSPNEKKGMEKWVSRLVVTQNGNRITWRFEQHSFDGGATWKAAPNDTTNTTKTFTLNQDGSFIVRDHIGTARGRFSAGRLEIDYLDPKVCTVKFIGTKEP